MAGETHLTGMVTTGHFRQIESVFQKHFGLGLEVLDVRAREVAKMCTSGCHPRFCRILKTSKSGAKRCHQDRLRSLSMAFETGQPYISLCHAGIMLVCVPVMEKDIPLGGFFFGKCLCEPINGVAEGDILKRLRGLRLERKKIVDAARRLPVISARTIHSASEFLFIVLYETTKLDPRIIQWHRRKSEQQAQISEFIRQRRKELVADSKYPYQSEQKLIGKVKIGDKTGAREILNSILGTIMFRNPGQLNVLKARLAELLGVLSRSAAEGGADIDFLLERNANYISKVITLDTQEDICAWISEALNDFIDSVYHALDSGRTRRLKPAIDYIDRNYSQKIGLADVAKAAYLSVSRLGHLFKEQMGMTVIDYLTRVRIDHAKHLLLATDDSCTQICFESGYNNQSYFCRTFKEIVGMTPRQFRKSNRRW
jgi:two-component system response regulator YesN